MEVAQSAEAELPVAGEGGLPAFVEDGLVEVFDVAVAPHGDHVRVFHEKQGIFTFALLPFVH